MRSGLVVALVGVALAALPAQARAVVTLDLLTGPQVRLDGAAGTGDDVGARVASAGDVNLDGRPDMLVGAIGTSNNGHVNSGSVYVVFGFSPADAAALPTDASGVHRLDLGGLSPTRGYRIDGNIDFSETGTSIASAGDVNGDGRPDVLIGAPGAVFGGTVAVYVVFGQSAADIAALPVDAGGAHYLDLGTLTVAQGYKIVGPGELGNSISSAGDLNGDGRPDALIGAPTVVFGGVGSAFAVFGLSPADVAALPVDAGGVHTLDLAALGPAQGYRIDGVPGDDTGASVASAGDVGGDARPDALVGAPGVVGSAGAAYVVFGQSPADIAALPADAGGVHHLDLGGLGPAQGYRIDGAGGGGEAGAAVASAGDVSGDGLADVLVAAPEAANNGRGLSGSAYVVFGQTPAGIAALPADAGGVHHLDLAALSTAQGYRIDGATAGEEFATMIANVGDHNGDGRPEALFLSPQAGNNGRPTSGSAWEVYGQSAAQIAALPADAGGVRFLDTSTLGDTQGRRIDGAAAGDEPNSIASAGDVNGDGLQDMLYGSTEPGAGAGAVYLVLGVAVVPPTLHSSVAAGVLTVTSDAADPILIACVADLVMVDGAVPDTGPAFCSSITAIVVTGGPGSNVIDLRGVEPGLFPALIGTAINGGAGDDTIYPSRVADDIHGGPGIDTVSYAGRVNPVKMTIGDGPNDGEAGEHDNIRSDVENLTGGSGNDTLIGSAGANVLDGGPGNDFLSGGLGPDLFICGTGVDLVSYTTRVNPVSVTIGGGPVSGEAGEGDSVGADCETVYGGSGNDVLVGNEGDNNLYGFGGNDTLIGNGGNDVLDAGSGSNVLDGGDGNDKLIARNGFLDTITCGAGFDYAGLDFLDVITDPGNCELVKRL